MSDPHHVVIVGGGFGGLHAANSLKRAPVRVTLIDRRNFHLFQPLLYQVATGGLSPANIAAPLRAILRRQRNVEVLLGEAVDIDVAGRTVILSDGELAYDTLIVAAGASHSYFGRQDWATLAPGLKTIEDATEIRRRILLAFEAAERETDTERRRDWLNFVIVGGGPTGCELAGAVAEIARYTLRYDFRHIDPADARVLLVEAADRVLPVYPPDLSAKAAKSLERLGIVVRSGTKVTEIQPTYVVLQCGDRTERLPTQTVIWAAGVQASPLASLLASATGASPDRAGRITVQPDLTLPGHPEIFVIGDMSRFETQGGNSLPGVAPVAIQEGRFVADQIRKRLAGNEAPATFQYRDRGTLATIGRRSAVALIWGYKLSGFFAWLLWLFVHIMQLVQFENRLLVLIQWGWNYVTHNRSARLITGTVKPLVESREQQASTAARE